MSRKSISKYKMERRIGINMWGSDKSAYSKKPYPPGQHGSSARKRKPSDYGLQFSSKQSLRYYYGNMTERQFRNTFKKSLYAGGNAGDKFLFLLESRLDVIVYRASEGFLTIFQAKQLVSHGHFHVNGKYVNIPSYVCRVGDIISPAHGSANISLMNQLFSKRDDKKDNVRTCSYVLLSSEDKTITYLFEPKVSDIYYPFSLNLGLVIEYYSINS